MVDGWKMESTEQFVHRTNIAKYRRILGTYLTTEERRFVERRLAEEQALLQQLAGIAMPENNSMNTP
jgi:hypothetical protein